MSIDGMHHSKKLQAKTVNHVWKNGKEFCHSFVTVSNTYPEALLDPHIQVTFDLSDISVEGVSAINLNRINWNDFTFQRLHKNDFNNILGMKIGLV